MAIAKNITSQILPVKERHSAEQPPLPCISNRKPNSREWNLSGKFDIKRQNCASLQETSNLSKSIWSIWQGCVNIRRIYSPMGIQLDPRAQIIHIHIFYVKTSEAPGRWGLQSQSWLWPPAVVRWFWPVPRAHWRPSVVVSGLSAAGKPKKITQKGADVPFPTVTGLDHGSFEFHFSRTTPCNSVRSKFRTASVHGINRRASFQELLDVVFVTAAHGIVQLRPA